MMGHLPYHLALVLIDERIRAAGRRRTLTGQRPRTRTRARDTPDQVTAMMHHHPHFVADRSLDAVEDGRLAFVRVVKGAAP
jgi:hypothetical protein